MNDDTTAPINNLVPFHFSNLIGIIGKITPINPPIVINPPQTPASPELIEYCSFKNFMPYPISVATINISLMAELSYATQSFLFGKKKFRKEKI